MAVFKFRVCWEDDENIFRDISLKSGQTFSVFQDTILKAFEFKESKPASFFESNEHWRKGREISSEVSVNKKNAPALSSIKTPVSALIDQPEKRFVFRFDPIKEWTFLITLIGLQKDEEKEVEYPVVLKSEGLSPKNNFGMNPLANMNEHEEDQLAVDEDDLNDDEYDMGSDDSEDNDDEEYGVDDSLDL